MCLTKKFNLCNKKTMSCEKCEITLINLHDNVLLRIFKFLNWIDSINLGATCTRIKNLEYWKYKKNEEFDLKEYVEKATIPIENLLSVIGPYIRVAKITEPVIKKSFMERCLNIKSLKIDECISRNAAITLNNWMKQIKIESLSIGQSFETDDIEKLLDGIEGLKAFVFENYADLPSDFFYKNSSIQHLLLMLLEDYDLSPLLVLHSLQSIHLQSPALQSEMITGLLEDVQKYVKMENLKEFSINCLEDNWDGDVWNNFATHLAKKSKLDNLRLVGYMYIDKETFSSLQLFNLTSLCLDVEFCWKDFSTILYKNVAPRLKYLKLQWPLAWCCSAKIEHILKIWTNLESICLQDIDDGSNHQLQFNDAFYSDILDMSDNRRGLRLHIFFSEICFNFISKRYTVVKERKSCTCKDSFKLWDGITCN